MPYGVFRNLTGERFERLLVVKRLPNRNRRVYYLCRCDCGTEKAIRAASLRQGKTVSCGCYHREMLTKHGRAHHTMYCVWRAMIRRCEYPSDPAWSYYGERGIQVCERWHDFEAFYADVGDPPSRRYSLDRVDNDGDYCPENSRWATWKEQQRNRRNNRMLTFQGKTRCMSEWAESTGLNRTTIKERLKRGWTVERALTQPVAS